MDLLTKREFVEALEKSRVWRPFQKSKVSLDEAYELYRSFHTSTRGPIEETNRAYFKIAAAHARILTDALFVHDLARSRAARELLKKSPVAQTFDGSRLLKLSSELTALGEVLKPLAFPYLRHLAQKRAEKLNVPELYFRQIWFDMVQEAAEPGRRRNRPAYDDVGCAIFNLAFAKDDRVSTYKRERIRYQDREPLLGE